MSCGSMDLQQSAALPLQLHGNSFEMSSGQVPKLSVGCGEGAGGGILGGGGSDLGPDQLNLTSAVPFTSRLNPYELSECQLDPIHCHGKDKLDPNSRRCSLTICNSGGIFPWMKSRNFGSKQSSKYFFLTCFGSQLLGKYDALIWLILQKH